MFGGSQGPRSSGGESAAYPDGLPASSASQAIGDSFARAHRNHLGLGLDLRSRPGAELFAKLVAVADAVFANFKPGTLRSLGFDYERLRCPASRNRAGGEQCLR